jgi:hypothetical protein
MKILILFVVILSSCASTTLYRDGKRVARFEGDMTEVKFTIQNGTITFAAETVDHSSATIAGGKVGAGNIAAGGIAIATSGLKF